MGRVLGLLFAFATIVPSTAAASAITLPSAGGSGYTFSATGATSDLIHFDAPFTGSMTFEYAAIEFWTVRSTPLFLAAGSCTLGSTVACYGNGTPLILPALPFRFDPMYSTLTWDLENVLTLDFSYPPPSTSFADLRNITLLPEGLASDAVATPEPATLLLLGAGFGAARLARRRRA